MILLGVQSCLFNSTDDYETKVLAEIFDDLVEEMGVLKSQEVPPPPSISILDNNDTRVHDTDECENKFNRIKAKNGNLRDCIKVIAVCDTLSHCLNEDLNIEWFREYLPDSGYIEAFNSMRDTSITNRSLDLSQIGERKEFILKYRSEFPEGFNIWERENYDFLFLGVLEVSRIYFDKKRQFGLLYSSYVCGKLCGEGAIICIHKIDGKWIIEKNISLWVS